MWHWKFYLDVVDYEKKATALGLPAGVPAIPFPFEVPNASGDGNVTCHVLELNPYICGCGPRTEPEEPHPPHRPQLNSLARPQLNSLARPQRNSLASVPEELEQSSTIGSSSSERRAG